MSETFNEPASSTSKLQEDFEMQNDSMQSELSDDSDQSSSDQDESSISHDILENPINPVDQTAFLLYSKFDYEELEDDVKKNCKILKFDSEWNSEEVLEQVKKFDPIIYQNLLIVVLEFDNIQFEKPHREDKSTIEVLANERKLRKALQKFSKNRPMILQVTSEDKKFSKFYFKNIGRTRFQKIIKNYTNLTDFPSFLWLFLNGKFENFKQAVLNSLPQVKFSSLLFRFLRVLEISEDFFIKLMLKCARNGSKHDIMAIMNFPLNEENIELTLRTEEYFTTVYEFKNGAEQSLLGNSIDNNNKDVHDFIIKCCSKMIGKFSNFYSFQVGISTVAFEKNKLDYLCDLIDVCDFPFPKELNTDSVEHEKFKQIIEERDKFNEAIKENNLAEIDAFIKKHPSLKFVYNSTNSSALHQTIGAKQFQLLSRLESLGFLSPEYHSYCETTTNESNKKYAKQIASRKRKHNVNSARSNLSKTVLSLSIKSFIHNKSISIETEDEYRKFIMKWLENIYSDSYNKPHLDLVAQCENLKMIFDFESDEVIGIDPLTIGANGIMYPSSRWIFIGAKIIYENHNREKEIKGVIAHESSHYAMELRYENDARPYFKFDKKREEEFTEIVNEINKWNFGDENIPDDECNEIISSVFRHYEKEAYHPELIVRVVQLRAQFAHDKAKLDALQEKYKPLFEYHQRYIMPDMRNFNLKDRENVRKFNKNTGKLEMIKNCKYKLTSPKNIDEITNSQTTIVETNTPSLLFLNIKDKLSTKFEKLMDAKCIFMSTENMKNSHMLKELKEILHKSSDLSIIIDCTKDFDDILKIIAASKKNHTIFIATNDNQNEQLANMIENVEVFNLSYSWNDLSPDSQAELIQNQVNFLGSKVTTQLLYSKKKEQTASDDNSGENLPTKIDDELFKLLVEKSEITIGKNLNVIDKDSIYFNALCHPRIFMKHQKSGNSESSKKDLSESRAKNSENKENYVSFYVEKAHSDVAITELTQDKLLEDVLNQKIVLISDGAGTGKSWVMKIMTKVMLKMYPTKWIALVDLKQFIKDFKDFNAHGLVVNFPKFLTECILKLETSYEKEIFYEMHENGKICIFFDGFDEIAPDYAEFVKELIKSFVFNDGNQLWISTRDFFEVDLQNELSLNVVYKLKPFKEEDGIKLITSSLILSDLENKKLLNNIEEIQNQIKSHNKYLFYEQQAMKLSSMICEFNNNSFGYPLFFQMIGEIFANKSIDQVKLTISGLYEEFVKIQYDRWSSQKGDLRKTANILFQYHNFNYFQFHQFIATKDSYSYLDSFSNPKYNIKDWPEEEIIAFGMLVKINDEFQFQHETFREFFVAQFLLRNLKNDLKYSENNEFYKYMSDVMLFPKFGIVRTFLNDALDNDKYAEKIKQMIPEIAKNIKDLTFLLDINRNRLEKLGTIWMDYFRSLNHDVLRAITFKDKDSILEIAKNQDLCTNFTKFPYLLLKSEDLYKLIKHRNKYENSFIHIVVLYNKVETIEIIAEELQKLLDKNQLEEIFTSKGNFGRNLLQLAAMNSKDIKTQQCVWNFVRNSCKSDEKFIEVVNQIDYNKSNVLHLAASFTTSEILDFIIEELEKITSGKGVKELLKSLGMANKIVLQSAAHENKSLDFHKSLWKFIRKYFDPSDILKMVTHIDVLNKVVLEYCVYLNTKEIAQFTWSQILVVIDSESSITNSVSNPVEQFNSYFKIILDNFDDLNYKMNFKVKWNELINKILMEISLKVSSQIIAREVSVTTIEDLHKIAPNSSLEFHKILWNILLETFHCKDELKKLLIEVNQDENNFLHLLVKYTNLDIIKFTFSKYENVFGIDEYHKMLRAKGQSKQNFLQISLINLKNVKLHKYLWACLQNSFSNKSEFSKLLMEVDNNKRNTIHTAVAYSTCEYFEFTIEELEKLLTFDEIKELLNTKGYCSQNLLQCTQSVNKSLKLFKSLWTVIEKYFNKSEILQMIYDSDTYEENIFHYAVICNTKEFVEFTWSQIKNYIIDREDQIEYLKRIGLVGRNLIKMSSINQSNDSQVKVWVENLLIEYNITKI